MTIFYKFLLTGYKSENGNHKWQFGRWYKFDGELDMCSAGFHCSKGIYQAFSYIQGEILAQVEVRGKHLSENDKEVWQEMRVIKSWKWNKKDNVLFAIYAAELVIDIFEKEYPSDDRPRKAIEAAKSYLNNPTTKNKRAAGDAGDAAGDAARAAGDAARAAGAAARAAGAAVRAAGAAAGDAWDAGAAARANLYKKLDKWMINHIKELRVLREI